LKFVEIKGGWLQPISNEENILLEKVRGHDGPLPKSSLEHRDRELARSLVSRGLLTRIMFEDKLCFVVNDLEEILES
jgi:hypothetical protein